MPRSRNRRSRPIEIPGSDGRTELGTSSGAVMAAKLLPGRARVDDHGASGRTMHVEVGDRHAHEQIGDSIAIDVRRRQVCSEPDEHVLAGERPDLASIGAGIDLHVPRLAWVALVVGPVGSDRELVDAVTIEVVDEAESDAEPTRAERIEQFGEPLAGHSREELNARGRPSRDGGAGARREVGNAVAVEIGPERDRVGHLLERSVSVPLSQNVLRAGAACNQQRGGDETRGDTKMLAPGHSRSFFLSTLSRLHERRREIAPLPGFEQRRAVSIATQA